MAGVRPHVECPAPAPAGVLRTSADDALALETIVSRPLVLFALMSVIWGIPYLFIRIAVAEVSPAFLVMARTGIAAAILLPIALMRTDLRPVLDRWRWLVAFAAIEIAIPWVLLASAEQKVTIFGTHVEHVDALIRAQYVAALTEYIPTKLVQ